MSPATPSAMTLKEQCSHDDNTSNDQNQNQHVSYQDQEQKQILQVVKPLVYVFQWLSHEGPYSPKHYYDYSAGKGDPTHCCTVLVFYYTIVATVSITSHDFLLQTLTSSPISTTRLFSNGPVSNTGFGIAMFLLGYAFINLMWRIFFMKRANQDVTRTTTTSTILYDYCWLCNLTLSMGALGILTNRPLVLWAYCAVVALDQTLWYVDLGVAAFTFGRVFPVGVAKYITWEDASWSSNIGCTHHLWTIPLLLYATTLTPSSERHYSPCMESVIILTLAFIYPTVIIVLCRWLIPSHIYAPVEVDTKVDSKGKDPTKSSTATGVVDGKVEGHLIYMNVNISYEFWKDVTLVRINHDNPNFNLYLFRLMWRMQWATIAFYSIIRCMFYQMTKSSGILLEKSDDIVFVEDHIRQDL
jgi:hypothetical protein